MMAELLGHATGYSGGKGGSMHIADMDKHMLGANGIVGGGMGLATGAALTAKLQNTGSVAICFFGDGALEQGILHETTNLAAIWKLPVVFVCENNQYAMSASVGLERGRRRSSQTRGRLRHPRRDRRRHGPVRGQRPGQRIRRARPARRGPGLPGLQHLSLPRPPRRRPAQLSRKGRGRALAPAATRSSASNRPRSTAARCAEAEIDALEQRIEQQIDEAVEFAKNSPDPTPDQLMTDIYA